MWCHSQKRENWTFDRECIKDSGKGLVAGVKILTWKMPHWSNYCQRNENVEKTFLTDVSLLSFGSLRSRELGHSPLVCWYNIELADKLYNP